MKRFLFLFALMCTLTVQAQSPVVKGCAEPAWIHFLDPVAAMGEGQKVTGTVMLPDGLKGSASQLNAIIADEIQRQLGRFPSLSVSTVDIIFYDTPSGNSRRNTRSGRSGSRVRSHSNGSKLNGLRQMLMERLGAESITLTVVPEDWETIIRVTEEQSDIRLKQAALDIMRNVGVQQGREQQLKALAGGETWRQLQQQVFPQVQRLDYKASFVRQSAGGVAVTLEGLYATARSHQNTGNDYYDIIDLAARLFPESVEAVVNAAGVALLRGDVQKAADYLQALQKDCRAYLHIGVMYMLRGDRTRAEVFLRMAETQGIPEAVAALRALHDGSPVWSE